MIIKPLIKKKAILTGACSLTTAVSRLILCKTANMKC